MVPLVNGAVRLVGELIPSVFVRLALDGVAEYVAEHDGFTTWNPSSTVPLHPVKDVMEKGAAAAQLAGLTDHTPESTRGHPVRPALEMPNPPLTGCTIPFT